MRSEKKKEFEEITNLRRNVSELKVNLAEKREEGGRGNLTITAKKEKTI